MEEIDPYPILVNPTKLHTMHFQLWYYIVSHQQLVVRFSSDWLREQFKVQDLYLGFGSVKYIEGATDWTATRMSPATGNEQVELFKRSSELSSMLKVLDENQKIDPPELHTRLTASIQHHLSGWEAWHFIDDKGQIGFRVVAHKNLMTVTTKKPAFS